MLHEIKKVESEPVCVVGFHDTPHTGTKEKTTKMLTNIYG